MSNPNEDARDIWVSSQLQSIQPGKSILDVGAGECRYKKHCSHLNYVSQDVARYDGKGDHSGLQTGEWDFSQIDIRCDILEIPEDKQYDFILCTEVIEHVPDAVAALKKLVRLTKPGGSIIITAPFISMTHFAPYHFATGFSRFFYQHHFDSLNCEITAITPNGGFFDHVEQEIRRSPQVYKRYLGAKINFAKKFVLRLAAKIIGEASRYEGDGFKKSSELMAHGWHVIAKKRAE